MLCSSLYQGNTLFSFTCIFWPHCCCMLGTRFPGRNKWVTFVSFTWDLKIWCFVNIFCNLFLCQTPKYIMLFIVKKFMELNVLSSSSGVFFVDLKEFWAAFVWSVMPINLRRESTTGQNVASDVVIWLTQWLGLHAFNTGAFYKADRTLPSISWHLGGGRK